MQSDMADRYAPKSDLIDAMFFEDNGRWGREPRMLSRTLSEMRTFSSSGLQRFDASADMDEAMVQGSMFARYRPWFPVPMP
ncbi:MAG: hypothetical protein BWY05_01341 [Euryarchaeota archaeon ADurb.Bin165]|nr:MAG: hypothetical protein BWY05_01341 [Euryarchaeota archaeon ADurb.Bin165]